MNKEDIQAALEAIGKGGITIAGDFVLEKHVEHEVANVESGGIGIQINNGGDSSSNARRKRRIFDARPRSMVCYISCLISFLRLSYKAKGF